MDRVECKHNHGVGCEDPSKCAACGWNPAEARRRLKAQKEAPLQEMKPRITYFEKITASPEVLAQFLASMLRIDRNSLVRIFAQEVADDGKDPLW